MDTLVPIERQPLGPTENKSQESWFDRRMRLVTSHLRRKGQVNKRSLIGSDSHVAPMEKEGELVQVSARVEKIVRKPDLEVVLAFLVEGASGTLQMFANCEIYDYDRRHKGEVLFRGKKVPLGELDRFILEDTNVMALVYWRSSRVVTTGKRWRVAKLWKPDPSSHVDVFSLTSWTHVNTENHTATDRSRSYNRRMMSVQIIKRASSEPPKLLSVDADTANVTEKKDGDSSEDQCARGRTFSWGTLMKKRIGCNVKSSNMSLPISLQPASVRPTDYSIDSANPSLPSIPTSTLDDVANKKDSSIPATGAGSHSSVTATQSLPLCLFAIPGVISQVKEGSSGTEYAVTFTRMGQTYEALMMKKYLSALMVDCVTETWINVHEMLVPGLQVVVDVKNVIFNKDRKWLVFGLYLGKLQRSEVAHFVEIDTSRKIKMKLKEEAWEKEVATNKDSDPEGVKDTCTKEKEVSQLDLPQFSVCELRDEINRQVKVNSKSSTPIQDETSTPIQDGYEANFEEDQVYSGISLMKKSESDNSFADDDDAGDKTCDHKFDYSGSISEIDSTTFSFIGPFGDRWINAKLSVAETNLYVDGVRVQDSSKKSSFLKKAKGAMGNLVISKCLKCSDFDLTDDNDLLINEACLAWFGIDNAPWLQGDLGKVSAFSSINEGKESLAVIRLANSSSKVWYNMSQHTGPQLSINSEVLVWAFRECTEAYYIGAAVVVVPEKSESQKLILEEQNQWTSTCQDSINDMEEVFLENSKMSDTGKFNDFEGAIKAGVKIEDVNYNIKSQGKMANPSEGSLSSVISPLDLESSLNSSQFFSCTSYLEIEILKLVDNSTDGKQESSENTKPINTTNDGKLDLSAVRTQSRSLPSTTDSEYSEVDYRGTLAQIEAFKKMESAEKKVPFRPTAVETDVSNHLHAGIEIEFVKTSDNRSTSKDGNNFKCHEDSVDSQQAIDNTTSVAEVEEIEDEVFFQVHDKSPNVKVKNASEKDISEMINNHQTNDDSWKFEMNKLLRDDKIVNQMESHDEFFKYAKLELTFGALVRDNSMMNLPNPIIDTQFEMILYVNDLDSPQLIHSQANTFDQCFENGDWTTTDPIERVGRFTVFGKDSPEKNSTTLLNNLDSTDENLPQLVRELSLPTEEHHTVSSLNLLPPIPEEKEICSDAVSEDDSLSGTDGCEYSMSWTYTKAHDGTPPVKIDPEAPSKDRSLSTTKVGVRTPPSHTAGPRQSPATNLIRYTSTPHLNKEEAVLERKFSADSSSLVHSFAACDSDSGLGDSNEKTALTETCFSFDGQTKNTKEASKGKNDMETDFTKKPCFWYTPTPPDTVPEEETSKLLIKENLKEFLSFTDFPEDHRSEIIERFMNSGKAIL